MRTKIIFLVALLLTPPIWALDMSQMEYSLVGVLGLGLLNTTVEVTDDWHSSVDEEDANPESESTAFLFGGGFEIRYYDFAAEADPIYSTYGFSVEKQSSSRRVDFSMTYLDLPVVAKYYFADLSFLQFYGLGGMVFSILMTQERDVPDGSGSSNPDFDAPTLAFGARVGGGTKFLITDNFFARAELAFQYNFTDFSETEGLTLETSKFDIIAGAGYSF